jgi:uncharacterized protein YuzE
VRIRFDADADALYIRLHDARFEIRLLDLNLARATDGVAES